MKSAITKFKFLFPALVLLFISSCKNNSDNVPFPENETEFPQPVSKPVKFSKPWKITWPDSVTGIKPLVKKFDFDKLPVSIFDSTGFLPFAKKPEEVQFNWDKLPDTVFNYDKLPSKPLKFETSILERPKLIKAGHPLLKTGTSSLVYEFGEIQGLADTFITCLFEDKAGFLWIATDQGIYRYDGENLLLYFHVSPGQLVFNMLEDNHGNIWMGTIGSQPTGLFVIDVKAGIIKHLAASQGLSSNFILSILLDNQGRIWITTPPGGVNIIDENMHTIKYFDKTQGLSNEKATGIIQDSKNNIWIGTAGSGINIVDLKNGKIKYLNKEYGLNSDSLALMLMDSLNRIWIVAGSRELNVVDVEHETIRHFNKDQGLNKNFILSLLNDRKGNIWIGTAGIHGNNVFGNSVKIIDPAREAFKSINTSNGLAENAVWNILQDNLGQIWIATLTGLNMLNRNGNNIEHFGKKDITSLAEDSHGQIWVASNYSGVEILDRATGLARSFTTANGLSNDTIQNMIAENGNIWIGTNGGIDIIDSARKTIEHLGRAQGLKTDFEATMMRDKQDNMWLGAITSDAAGVDVLDLLKRTVHHLGIAQGLKDTSVTDMKQDRQGQVWLTTFTGGVYVIDPEKNMIKYLNDAPGLKARWSKLLLPDEHGNMWIGTDKGIYVVNTKRDSIMSFSTREGLINDDIFSLHEYNGHIYVGTSGGVTIITPPSSSQKNWLVESFGKAQGINKLTNNFASDIITKKGRFLWGDKGLTVLDNANEDKIVPNTYITGIDIFNQPQSFADNPWSHINENDTLWSPKKDTFYVKGQLPVNTLFTQHDKMKWDSVTNVYNMPVNLHLLYYQNYLQFHFTQSNLGGQDTTWYSYILQGIDKKWSDRTYNSYSQNYLNLPPGDYIFKVSGMYKGNWSQPMEFKFTITPPWWQTWWAYGLYIFIFIGLVWAFAQYRSRKLKRENLLLEEKITQRTDQLRHSLEELKATQAQLIQSEKMASLGELTAGIAHEIQNPLNFVNNFSEVNTELIDEMQEEIDKGNMQEVKTLSNDIKENEQKINHHGKRADAIVKGMLQHSRSSTGVKELTDINALADEYLRLSFHGLRARDKTFNAIMKTDFDGSLEKIKIIPQDVGRVILNLFTNAFYSVTEKKKLQVEEYEPTVSVSTKGLGNKVEIRVKDNGMGVPQKIVDKIFQPFFSTKPTGQGTGLGLSLSYDIITKEHNGQLNVETKEGEFAEFIIILPYH